jgi:hypothetical protein
MSIIVTKYIESTLTKGARISARSYSFRIIVPWQDELGLEDNHVLAAKKLVEKYPTLGTHWKGTSSIGRGWTFIRVDSGAYLAEFTVERKP